MAAMLTFFFFSHSVSDVTLQVVVFFQEPVYVSSPYTSSPHITLPRKIQVGGGVGIFLLKQFTNIEMVNRRTYESFEHLEINFNCDKQRTTVVVLYRTPRTSIIEHYVHNASCKNQEFQLPRAL